MNCKSCPQMPPEFYFWLVFLQGVSAKITGLWRRFWNLHTWQLSKPWDTDFPVRNFNIKIWQRTKAQLPQEGLGWGRAGQLPAVAKAALSCAASYSTQARKTTVYCHRVVSLYPTAAAIKMLLPLLCFQVLLLKEGLGVCFWWFLKDLIAGWRPVQVSAARPKPERQQ